jgi:hypothetical protein
MKHALLAPLGLLLVLSPATGQAPERQKATVVYLQKLQQKDGGFAPAAGQAKSSLGATSSAIRALKYFGGEIPDRSACEGFVKSCFDKASGGFADTPGGKPDVRLTAVGVMAVVELKLPRDDYEAAAIKYLGDNAKTFDDVRIAAAGMEALAKKSPQADAWLEQVNKMRNADGTFGKDDGLARDTGGAVVVLLRLGTKLENTEAVLKTLKAGQRKDGGFGKADTDKSDLESSYRVMRAFHMLKAKPDAERLAVFVDRCRNDDGGYGVAPGQPSTVAGTYYAGIITHWLSEK